MLIGGQVLSVKRPMGIIHYGLSLGGESVVDNSLKAGISLRTLADFADGAPINVGPAPDAHTGAIRMARAVNEIGKPYNLITNNCEQHITNATEGSPRSPQLEAAIIVSGLVLCLFLITRKA